MACPNRVQLYSKFDCKAAGQVQTNQGLFTSMFRESRPPMYRNDVLLKSLLRMDGKVTYIYICIHCAIFRVPSLAAIPSGVAMPADSRDK